MWMRMGGWGAVCRSACVLAERVYMCERQVDIVIYISIRFFTSHSVILKIFIRNLF